jgi:hypothetical protein
LSLHTLGAPVLLAALAACLGGCAGETSFDSPESAARLRAIQRAAAKDDRASIPQLIEMLDSDDAAVRILSIRTLESMTGQTLGYDPTAPSYERTPAVDRWEGWYASQQAPTTERKQNQPSDGPSASDPIRPENRNTESTGSATPSSEAGATG